MLLIVVSNPRLIKIILFFLCLIPFAWLVWRGLNAELGANPVETVTRYTGDWTLRFLLITLSVTPVRRLSGWNTLIRYRRMLGLFSFFYASIHFSIYVIDQYFSVATIVEDILKRPYITVGFSCFILLIPLAITSANNMVRWLGAKRWQRLHQLIYVIAIGGVLHFLWLVKSDISEPLLYGTLLCGLLGYRVWNRYNQKQA